MILFIRLESLFLFVVIRLPFIPMLSG